MFSNFMKFLSPLIREYCLLCTFPGQSSYPICAACCQDLTILSQSCSFFRQEKEPYTQIFHLFPYKFPITQLIIALKFGHDLKIARTLGLMMAEKIKQTWYVAQPLPDLIIPIPLHYLRLRERGFNQALEIAKPISQQLKLSINNTNLIRVRATTAQSGLSASERSENLKGAFSVSGEMTGLHIAVLDDVVTTGHTISAACLALKQAGAKQVDVWCCARA